MQKDSGLNDTWTRAALGMKKEKCSLLYIDSSRLSFLCVILERSEESRFFSLAFLVSFRAAAAKNPAVFFYDAALKTK
jgi:hypothetical protein